MDIPRKTREELNALSKVVFGSSSKWQKYLNGIPEIITKTVVETVPGDFGAPDTTQEKTVPLLADNGAKQYTTKFYSIDEIRELLLKFKAQREAIMKQIKAAEDLKKTQQKVQELASGETTRL